MIDLEQINYKDLAKIVAERSRPIVPCIGAGTSVGAGLPTWSELRDRLAKAAAEAPLALASDRKEIIGRRIELARAETNLWNAITMLGSCLGDATFEAVVRDALSTSHITSSPDALQSLWKLRPPGMLTLNLDDLAESAFLRVHPGEFLRQVAGQTWQHARDVLVAPKRWMIYLHGLLDIPSTWVLTDPALQKLRAEAGYRHFLEQCLDRYTILFVGITLDDIALASSLTELRAKGGGRGPHFWITDRTDAEAIEWAESVRVRIITYTNSSGTHAELDTCLNALLQAVSRDDALAIPMRTDRELPEAAGRCDPATLQQLDDGALRIALNTKVNTISAMPREQAQAEYRRFLDEYDPLLHRAWFLPRKLEDYDLLGYRLKRRIGSGAFGQVIKAAAPDGATVAIKLLHEDQYRADVGYLEAFRRGVDSIRCLARAGISGVVSLREAFEVPAMMVMEYVDGKTLQDAVELGELKGWVEKLRVSAQIADVISRAHSCPEAVLHRDVRPHNVMVARDEEREGEFRVVVLDFDLSWHLGAFGKTFISANSPLGYLAPEQLRRETARTRDARVDSFGLGMTLYYIFSGRQPSPNEQLIGKWQERVVDTIGSGSCSEWKSAPRRVAALICAATDQESANRPVMDEMLNELKRLADAVEAPRRVRSAELVAEELFARSGYVSTYTWDEARSEARLATATGLEIKLTAREEQGRVLLRAQWSRTGSERRRGLENQLREREPLVRKCLSDCGWEVDDVVARGQMLVATAQAEVENIVENLGRFAKAIEELPGKMQVS